MPIAVSEGTGHGSGAILERCLPPVVGFFMKPCDQYLSSMRKPLNGGLGGNQERKKARRSEERGTTGNPT
jgi:hypothetical protein